MTIVLIFVIAYVALSTWDVVHVNNLVGRMVDPAGYQRAHPAAPPEPAPRLVIAQSSVVKSSGGSSASSAAP